MSTRRLGVAVAVLGGFLYAVGGSDGTSPLNTGIVLSHVVKYNPKFTIRIVDQLCSITPVVNRK